MKFNDIYKVIDYEKKKYFLFCMVKKDTYIWVRSYDWGFVSNNVMSASDPIEFIGDQVKAINSETSSGVDTIKRIYYQNLPKKVKDLLKL